MKKLVILLIFLFNFNALASNLIKVAVIDTGLKPEYNQFAHLCPFGHKDFTGEGLEDINGHGTNVTGLITNNAQSNGYCIVIIKAYAYKFNVLSLKYEITPYVTEALEYAHQINAQIINLSGGGSFPIYKEEQIVRKILNANRILIVAAGNGNNDLDKKCVYYPACYDSRIYVIGNSGELSNYGKVVDLFYYADNQMAFGQKMSGSSQATALFTGKLLKNIDSLRKVK